MTAEGRDAAAPTRRSRLIASIVIVATGVVLSVGLLPMLYNQAQSYDDEGALLLGIREFIHRGSLYHHSTGYYGPFWYSAFGAFYRLIGQDPTPFTGRLIVLVLTGLGACIFAATVYRVTRSLAAAVLCEVVTFFTLIRVAGNEPMHPASSIIVLLGVLIYCLTSNLLRPRPVLVGIAGFATTAIVLSKINVGLLVVVALAIWLMAGAGMPRIIRILVIAGAAIFPFVLMGQNLTQSWVGVYAVLVSVSLLLLCVVATAGSPLPNEFKVVPFAIGVVVTVFASVIWPLLHGTSFHYLIDGVFVRPLNQTHALTVPAAIKLSWPLFIASIAGVLIARDPRVVSRPVREDIGFLGLGATGVIVLGLASFGSFAAWLPIIVLVPAIALFIKADRVLLSLLVFTTAIAAAQVLHAYPVASSQVAWSTVAMAVPCSIAVGVALQRFAGWRAIPGVLRVGVTVGLCAFLMLGAGFWPPQIWHDYLANPPLNLAGARLLRLPGAQVGTLQGLTLNLKANCDTFYSVPPSDSLYFYTGIPSPSGQTVDNYGIMNAAEQREIVAALEAASKRGERVCMVRNAEGFAGWSASSTGTGPLGRYVSTFTQLHTTIGIYTVSTQPDQTAVPPANQPSP